MPGSLSPEVKVPPPPTVWDHVWSLAVCPHLENTIPLRRGGGGGREEEGREEEGKEGGGQMSEGGEKEDIGGKTH